MDTKRIPILPRDKTAIDTTLGVDGLKYTKNYLRKHSVTRRCVFFRAVVSVSLLYIYDRLEKV